MSKQKFKLGFRAFLIVLFTELEHAGANLNSRAAIINGYNAVQKRSFYVSVQVSAGENRTCGGTIIDPYHVLTAAHCVTGFNSGKVDISVLVEVGDFTVPADQRKTRKLTATKVFVHERWFNNTFSLEGDIAIIKLPTKMSRLRERDVLKPCTDFEDLANDKSPESELSQVHAIGLGRTSFTLKKEIPPQLQETVLSEACTRDTCPITQYFVKLDDILSQLNWTVEPVDFDFHKFVPSKQICLYDPAMSSNACSGDSGGPVFHVLKSGTAKCVYGITSYGGAIPDKCYPEYGSIYTRVSAYIDWIEEKTTEASF